MKEGLEPQVKFFSILSKLGDVVSNLVQLKQATRGGMGVDPSAAG